MKQDHKSQRVFGLAGWSGSGKTTLGLELLARFSARGLIISTLKHAHHSFDIDQPGKDSYRHRQAGAAQVLISSAQRWALMQELREQEELTFSQALEHFAPCDLILVEGYKQEDFPKLEIHRPALGKPLLYGQMPGISAIASDQDLGLGDEVPLLDLNNLDQIEAWILQKVGLWHN